MLKSYDKSFPDPYYTSARDKNVQFKNKYNDNTSNFLNLKTLFSLYSRVVTYMYIWEKNCGDGRLFEKILVSLEPF